MKRILALFVLSVMIGSFFAPIFSVNNHNDSKQETKIITTKDIELNVGASKVIFEKPSVPDWKAGWTTERVNIRTKPSLDSEIITICDFNGRITYDSYNEDWNVVYIEGESFVGYISAEYVTTNQCDYEEYDFPYNTGFKSYMAYTALTNKSSKQYELQDKYAYTASHGLRQVNNRYCVAIGTAFDAEIGTYIDLILENDEVVPCVVSDIKSDIHTKSDNITTVSNGCVIEFLTDSKEIDKRTKRSGDVSSCFKKWDSPASKIIVYDKNIFGGGRDEEN